jgi:hypothetical protein
LAVLLPPQAAVLNLLHLTNERRRTKTFPDVGFEFFEAPLQEDFPAAL